MSKLSARVSLWNYVIAMFYTEEFRLLTIMYLTNNDFFKVYAGTFSCILHNIFDAKLQYHSVFKDKSYFEKNLETTR